MRKLIGTSRKLWIFIFLTKRIFDLINCKHVSLLRSFNTLTDFIRLFLSQFSSSSLNDEVIMDAAFNFSDFFFCKLPILHLLNSGSCVFLERYSCYFLVTNNTKQNMFTFTLFLLDLRNLVRDIPFKFLNQLSLKILKTYFFRITFCLSLRINW